MSVRPRHTAFLAVVAAATSLAIAACSPPADDDTGTSGSGVDKAKTATSAADLGGMDALVAAAKKEGTLNVIALPPDWANYGAIISAFGTKYGIKVTSAQPDASSADEISAANRL
jgi:putative spermidine/putrescine transport system substrate-binding protein